MAAAFAASQHSQPDTAIALRQYSKLNSTWILITIGARLLPPRAVSLRKGLRAAYRVQLASFLSKLTRREEAVFRA